MSGCRGRHNHEGETWLAKEKVGAKGIMGNMCGKSSNQHGRFKTHGFISGNQSINSHL